MILKLHKLSEILKPLTILSYFILQILFESARSEFMLNTFFFIILMCFFIKGFTGFYLRRNYNFPINQLYIDFRRRKLNHKFQLLPSRGKVALILNLLEISPFLILILNEIKI